MEFNYYLKKKLKAIALVVLSIILLYFAFAYYFASGFTRNPSMIWIARILGILGVALFIYGVYLLKKLSWDVGRHERTIHVGSERPHWKKRSRRKPRFHKRRWKSRRRSRR